MRGSWQRTNVATVVAAPANVDIAMSSLSLRQSVKLEALRRAPLSAFWLTPGAYAPVIYNSAFLHIFFQSQQHDFRSLRCATCA